MPYDLTSVESITGRERRRRYSANGKSALMDGTMQPGMTVLAVARQHGAFPSLLFKGRQPFPPMRLAAALFTFVCLSACSMAPSPSEQALGRPDDEWRQRQAVQDANIILHGMSQARQRREELARTAR